MLKEKEQMDVEFFCTIVDFQEIKLVKNGEIEQEIGSRIFLHHAIVYNEGKEKWNDSNISSYMNISSNGKDDNSFV